MRHPAPPAGGARRALLLRAVLACVVLPVALAACTARTGGHPRYGTDGATPAAPARLPVRGGGDGEVDRLAANAMADIQRYWRTEFPRVFGRPYRPISTFYSVDPDHLPAKVPCIRSASTIRGNAIYCPSADAIVWDRTDFFPDLIHRFGTYPVALVLAHETGHAIQDRTRDPGQRPISLETQADCYSGAFARAAFTGRAPHFPLDSSGLDGALESLLAFADTPGENPDNARAHGNAFDRISAFQEGFASGAGHCADHRYFSDRRQYTEAPFTGGGDARRQGNTPYRRALRLAVRDLNAFWRLRPGFRPLAVRAVDPDHPARCGGAAVRERIGYCAPSNTVYYDAVALPALHRASGDFAMETMLAVAYGLADEHDRGRPVTGGDGILRAICSAGAYTHDLMVRPEDHDQHLSPGDLDEALHTLLTGFGADTFSGPAGTTGFQRVRAFRIGVGSERMSHSCG